MLSAVVLLCLTSLEPRLAPSPLPVRQVSIARIDQLPNQPSPYVVKDWRKTALDLDHFLLAPNASGQFRPLVWRVPNVPNLGDGEFSRPGFGMPSYVGQEKMRGQSGEAITQLGVLLGGTAVGQDESSWVQLTPQFLNAKEGLILNNVGGKSGGSFWYELLPSLDFIQLAMKYPTWSEGKAISRRIADIWQQRQVALGDNFNHTSFDPVTNKGLDNGMWREPDASAAVAYLELAEALKSGQTKYLTGARRALKSLASNNDNPTYEILTPYGALAAAYLNAERGDHWDVDKLIRWCFEPTSPNRTGWGMITGKWGGLDVGGLIGSTTDGGGYSFAMNTYLSLATLAPIARYQPQYSATLAKWVLNATNASRLYYGDGLPLKQQSSGQWREDSDHCLAYEGLRKEWEHQSPYAAGDAKRSGWAKTDFGLYGSGYVGLLGALVRPTNVPMILEIDLRATDFLPIKANPTRLYWNPYSESKTVKLDLGPKPVRAYDVIAKKYLTGQATHGCLNLKLLANQAVQLVFRPN